MALDRGDAKAAPSEGSRLRRDVLAGLRIGCATFWDLAKLMIPAYLAALVLQRVGAVEVLAKVAAPVMRVIGLPGEAAVPLVFGWILNLYAVIGAMQPLTLSPREITLLALAALISHNLIVEGAVIHRTGMSGVAFGILRVIAGLAAAGIANQLMGLF